MPRCSLGVEMILMQIGEKTEYPANQDDTAMRQHISLSLS